MTSEIPAGADGDPGRGDLDLALPEHVQRNRAAWDEWAPDYVSNGEVSWRLMPGDEKWGVWDIPEPDPARCEKIELESVDFALVPALVPLSRGSAARLVTPANHKAVVNAQAVMIVIATKFLPCVIPMIFKLLMA